MLLTRIATFASCFLVASRALADEPAPPSDANPADPPATPEPAPVPAPAAPAPASSLPPSAPPDPDKPVVADEASRPSGLRLGLDLGFQRAFAGAVDRLNQSSPTLLPIGVDVSFRTSRTFMAGVHGYIALASRDDCIEADHCRARGYGFGAHVEGMLARGQSWVFWLRYGLGYEILYQGGQPLDPSGHIVRGALDLMDVRTGIDFTIHRRDEGKTARIGPFAGLVAGTLVNQTGVTRVSGSGGQPRNLDRDTGSAHVWFALGVRATLDP